MKLSNQQQKVYDLLLKKGHATAREIIRFTNYPSCLIRDLKYKGIKIATEPIKNKNYCNYILVRPQPTIDY